MNIGKIASRIFLVLFLLSLALGVFMVVIGGDYVSEGMSQGGGGLVVLMGGGFAGVGYIVIGTSVLGVGIPWVVTAYLSRADSQRNSNRGESDPVHAENAESDDPQSTVDAEGVQKAIRGAWKGEERLWIVFWVYFWLIGIVVSVGSGFLADAGLLAELVAGVLGAAWLVWIAVSQWRCSSNTSWRGWGYVVRVLVVFSVVAWAYDVYLSVVAPETL